MAGRTFVVVGLGNPGPDYAGNRHNVGQMVLDELASRMGATFKKHKTPNQVAEGRLVPGGTRLVLAKPGSFMNTSGGPVSSVLGFYGATPADLVVVHDELDLPFDTVRLKGSGGHGGHNGLRDIIKATSPQPRRRRCRSCWPTPPTRSRRSPRSGCSPHSSACMLRPERSVPGVGAVRPSRTPRPVSVAAGTIS
jgi:aminoacyl-tRNA hydrolase